MRKTIRQTLEAAYGTGLEWQDFSGHIIKQLLATSFHS
jgi:hypothetical protein